MKTTVVALLVFCSAVILFAEPAVSQAAQQPAAATYVCLPCGNECDTQSYTAPGRCRHCNMDLVEKSTVRFKNVQANAICNYIKSHPGAVLLDVRTREEFEGKQNPDYGRLKNAINIPVQELEARLSEISSLKNKEIIVYCSHSHRSPRASYLLGQNGFVHVTNLAGGMSVMADTACKVAGKR
jgi:rhodanese-related sulfurtransferase/DNA-directed RNA polymerase subunit RPC12/RpoP